jgi:D-aspartate ligase
MKEFISGAVVVSSRAYDLNAIGAVRSLGMSGVNVTWVTPDRSRWYYSRYCKPIICPSFKTDEDRFIQFLLRLGEKRKPIRDVLIPTSDAALIAISKNKMVLEKYFRSMVCDWGTVEKFIDKIKIYKIAESLGIQTPRTFCPRDKNEATRIAHEISYPCLVKPTISHTFTKKFKKKLFKANNRLELLEMYSNLTSKGFRMMVQEDIHGEDRNLITLNTVFNDNSEPLVIFMHRRLRQNPPKYGVVALGESVWEPRIIDPAIKLLKAIGFQGIAHVEFKLDPWTNDFKFIELNGRSYLSISLPTACGINLIYTAYRNAIGEKVPPLKNYKCIYECGVKWLDLPSYIESIIKLREIKHVPLGQSVRPLLSRKLSFATLSRDDPAPLLMELIFLIKNFRKILYIASSSSG